MPPSPFASLEIQKSHNGLYVRSKVLWTACKSSPLVDDQAHSSSEAMRR